MCMQKYTDGPKPRTVPRTVNTIIKRLKTANLKTCTSALQLL